jgi:hypothetical protein
VCVWCKQGMFHEHLFYAFMTESSNSYYGLTYNICIKYNICTHAYTHTFICTHVTVSPDWSALSRPNVSSFLYMCPLQWRPQTPPRKSVSLFLGVVFSNNTFFHILKAISSHCSIGPNQCFLFLNLGNFPLSLWLITLKIRLPS